MQWNASTSLPFKAFFHFPHRSLPTHFGHYVTFSHAVCPKTLAKQIVGVEGDRVIIENGVLYIQHRVGALQPSSSTGDPLNPLPLKTIPKGYVFVAGTHEKSMDSRYASFGLIPLKACTGVYPW